ncbi:hypothetical protein K420107F6_00680 [Lactonifactor longoviformis]
MVREGTAYHSPKPYPRVFHEMGRRNPYISNFFQFILDFFNLISYIDISNNYYY